jgi:hypothetical protein
MKENQPNDAYCSTCNLCESSTGIGVHDKRKKNARNAVFGKKMGESCEFLSPGNIYENQEKMREIQSAEWGGGGGDRAGHARA